MPAQARLAGGIAAAHRDFARTDQAVDAAAVVGDDVGQHHTWREIHDLGGIAAALAVPTAIENDDVGREGGHIGPGFDGTAELRTGARHFPSPADFSVASHPAWRTGRRPGYPHGPTRANKRRVTSDWLSIETRRLVLRTLPPAALAALVAGDRAEASRLAGCDLGDFPDEERGIAEVRLKDVTDNPSYLPWSLRAMALKPGLAFVGHFNFHSKPGADYLAELAPGAVEFGYFVMPAYRRRGLAEEAALGMMDWARRSHGVGRFVVSISPDNAPSVAMAAKLGFAKIGSHIDEIDGYEDIFALDTFAQG